MAMTIQALPECLETAVQSPEIRSPEASVPWKLDAFAGRLVEISGDESAASLSLVFRLVYEAQRRGEPAAWIGRRECAFFPPDVARAGIDLAALPVHYVVPCVHQRGANFRAADARQSIFLAEEESHL